MRCKNMAIGLHMCIRLFITNEFSDYGLTGPFRGIWMLICVSIFSRKYSGIRFDYQVENENVFRFY